ncbi:hypothetical protein P153DRAFT_368136 [Dothidotthia symphoricarpi CBS 119687]|uniref:Uncharacterized protein n=1 Tax=Dothidotthia symphoricarpi CBS 119687 TaxID=1392245 RepID=A0A6A6A6A1_9PLEO|nr:uncharacterized protein P153DRAFT_368136 [Dothidotthia symphoricarpi CBS 119687]KAF2127502.1 hypothetical protein P153DRAFT_368136 [Dothidotthia symphoricarpi CBS 119687]
MSPPSLTNMSTRSSNDVVSLKSISISASKTSLFRSLFPSKQPKKPAEEKSAETPAMKSERRLVEAEARHAYAVYR